MASISDNAQADRLLTARLDDVIRLSDKYACPRFLGFLDERERAVAETYLKRQDAIFRFYGGHTEAERVFVGVIPAYFSEDDTLFPITRMAFTFRKETKLTHRDVLGTLLSAGVKREKVGDILCGDGLVVVMVDEEIVPFLSQQITRVRGEGVSCIADYDGELPVFHRFSPIKGTVSAPRLDAVLKVLIGTSRETAAEHIRVGRVSLNHTLCTSVSHTVNEGDIVSVRGFGRYRIEQIGAQTQKGRLWLYTVHYI